MKHIYKTFAVMRKYVLLTAVVTSTLLIWRISRLQTTYTYYTRRMPIVPNTVISESDCEMAIANRSYAIKLPVLSINDSIDVDKSWSSACEQIKQRGYYHSHPSPPDAFPIAFVRIVYQDYHLQELLLNAMYAPENIYCYAIDAKAPSSFHSQMKNLSRCLSNVIIANQSFPVDSRGHNTTKSFMQCLTLIRSAFYWNYAILLQTNAEMVGILKALNGTNDIEMFPPNRTRIPHNMDWTYQALGLFRDSSKNDGRVLEISKGSTCMSLSRAFVEFVIDQLNLTRLIDRFEAIEYGNDEMIFPSLNADQHLDAPGGFTRHCIGKHDKYISRYVAWRKDSSPCHSGVYRHSVCVFGMADLSTLKTSKSLFANKMIPRYDYSAIVCWLRHLVRRNEGSDAMSYEYYTQLKHVQFNNDRGKWRRNIHKFECGDREADMRI